MAETLRNVQVPLTQANLEKWMLNNGKKAETGKSCIKYEPVYEPLTEEDLVDQMKEVISSVFVGC